MSVDKNDKLRARLYEDLLDATENAQNHFEKNF